MKRYRRMTRKAIEKDLDIWLGFMQNEDLHPRFREYAESRMKDIEAFLLD